MTNEEAIVYWEGLRKTFHDHMAKEESPFGKQHYQTSIEAIDAALSALCSLTAAEFAPVVHGVPISKNRPQKYEMYEEAGTGENGETLYRKRIYVGEKNSVEYCPACGKRLCSRFRSFCPNCGAKMDGTEERG